MKVAVEESDMTSWLLLRLLLKFEGIKQKGKLEYDDKPAIQ